MGIVQYLLYEVIFFLMSILQCSNNSCRVAYHPLCARAAGLCVEVFLLFFPPFSNTCFLSYFVLTSIVCWFDTICSPKSNFVFIYLFNFMMYSLRMRTGCIYFLLMMMKISAYAYFLSARNIGNHLMNILLLMIVQSEFLVYVQTMNHRLIRLVVLEVV